MDGKKKDVLLTRGMFSGGSVEEKRKRQEFMVRVNPTGLHPFLFFLSLEVSGVRRDKIRG